MKKNYLIIKWNLETNGRKLRNILMECKKFLKIRNENYLKNYYYSQIRKKIRKFLIHLKNVNFFEVNKINIEEGNVSRIQFFIKKEKINFNQLSIDKMQKLILKYKGIPLERLIISKIFDFTRYILKK